MSLVKLADQPAFPGWNENGETELTRTLDMCLKGTLFEEVEAVRRSYFDGIKPKPTATAGLTALIRDWTFHLNQMREKAEAVTIWTAATQRDLWFLRTYRGVYDIYELNAPLYFQLALRNTNDEEFSKLTYVEHCDDRPHTHHISVVTWSMLYHEFSLHHKAALLMYMLWCHATMLATARAMCDEELIRIGYSPVSLPCDSTAD